jgi:hypothetical protein
LVSFALERERGFVHFSSLLLEHDLVMLMKKHGKEVDAEELLRGELRVVNFDYCEIGDDGAFIVAAFIKGDVTVEMVYLGSCNIGPRGTKAIADAVKHSKTVWCLNFNWNQIGDDGAEAVLIALSHNVCIIGMLIRDNDIAPESQATIKYLTETRNAVLIPAAVRRTSLYLISARRNISDAGRLAIVPKEIVRMIAMAVWATRKDPKWIEALRI